MTRFRAIIGVTVAFFVLSTLVAAQTFTPVLPHSYPLAVRNPYTSTWLPGDQAAHLPSATPQFWSGGGITWSVLARVDGTTYSLFGAPGGPQAANVLGGAYTSTRSTFTLSAGNALFTLDFLSPVAPNDYIYTDIDDSWLGIDSDVSYNLSTTGATSLFQWVANDQTTYLQSQSEQALWGTVVYASQPGCDDANLTAATGAMSDVRGQFTSSGSLDGSTPGWASGSVTAFSHDLGSVRNGGSNVTYAIGVARDQVVSFLGADWTHYYRATYADTPSAVDHFLNDYSSASADSQALDAAIAGAANSAAGANYSDIVTLSVRQAYASCDFSISDDSKNTSDPLIFLKEISSDGNVNTVDVLYPIFPIFYVLNAASIRYITEPVIRFLEIGQWNESYACHDIGSAYPVADGHLVGQEFMPVEESANLLILASLYAMSTRDTNWSSSHGTLFRTLGDFLAGNATNEAAQYSSDDGLGPLANQTTLAIKAAVGLNAIGAMFNSNNYTQAGGQLANLLYNQTMGTDAERTHFTRIYPNMTNSWTMAYNMYPDKVLRLNTFPQAAYDMESSYYPTVRATAGVPLDDTTDWTKSDWMMWSGAIASQDTRNMMVNDLHQYITTTIDSVPFSDRFFVSHEFGNATNGYYDYKARPVVGGHFAILALANGANSIDSRSSPGSSACAGGSPSGGSSSTTRASSTADTSTGTFPSPSSLVSSDAVTTVIVYTTTTVCPSGQTVTQEGGSTSVLKAPSISTYLATATHVSDTTVFATTFTTDYMTDIAYTTVTA
ncbi:MAG: hypothetical protein Q9157_006532 [Trypethelium eluteriae]